MGGSSSKEETTQDVKSSGMVNNNVIVDDHIQITNKDVVWIMYVIAGAIVLSLVLKMYQMFYRGLKKRVQRAAIVDQA